MFPAGLQLKDPHIQSVTHLYLYKLKVSAVKFILQEHSDQPPRKLIYFLLLSIPPGPPSVPSKLMNTSRLFSLLTHFLPLSKMPHPPLPHISSYERMTGGCTRLLAAEMISFSPPIDASSYILDNACGPGIVTSEIKSRHPPARIMAADLAPAMTEEVQTSVQMNGWSNVETATLDIRSLDTLKDESFTHVFANLALPVPRDPLAGMEASREMFRVLKPRGVAMVSTWAGQFPGLLIANTPLLSYLKHMSADCV
jgi:SAM-dependent methyltransferase